MRLLLLALMTGCAAPRYNLRYYDKNRDDLALNCRQVGFAADGCVNLECSNGEKVTCASNIVEENR